MEIKFECINGDEQKLKQAFRFRYHIFCIEKKFYNRKSYNTHLETDIFDAHSLHFAAFDPRDNIIGYVRLVCFSENGYPMQEICPYTIDRAQKYTGCHTAEISRLAISADYRTFFEAGRNGNKEAGSLLSNPSRLCQAPKIQAGLYRLMYFACRKLKITHLFAVMEKSLYQCLYSFSIRFEPLGAEFENHGVVAPYIGVLTSLGKGLFPGQEMPLSVQDNVSEEYLEQLSFFIASNEEVWA